MVPIVGRNSVLRYFARAGVSTVRLGWASVRWRSVLLRGLAASLMASLRVVAFVAPLGVVPVARPVTTADDRFCFPRRRVLADLAALLEVLACSNVFRSESEVADVEGAALSLVSHHAAVTKDVFIVTLIAAGGVGG